MAHRARRSGVKDTGTDNLDDLIYGDWSWEEQLVSENALSRLPN